MKTTDDYKAKIRMWAATPRVVPLPQGPVLPQFRSQRFKSHAEMNQWKQDLVRRAAQEEAKRSIQIQSNKAQAI